MGSSPRSLTELPDRAGKVPNSWIAGYWGRTFSNGHEQHSEWRPQDLRRNDEVGFLVTLDGECIVFVNDVERCRFADPPVPVKSQSDIQLTALLDLSATTASVKFQAGGAPPPTSAARRKSTISSSCAGNSGVPSSSAAASSMMRSTS